MFTLKGRTAVMTAAPNDTVRALLEGGMNVGIITHGADRVNAFIASLPKELQPHCRCVPNDGGDDAALVRAAEMFGGIDVVIPNHGGPIHSFGLEELTDDEFERKLHNIPLGHWKMIRAALPYLKKSPCGRIIMISSVGGINGCTEESLADCAVRGAIEAMCYRLARELAPDGITVNCIAKGGMYEKGDFEAFEAQMAPKIPMKKVGGPQNFASAIAWLASEEAGFVTGQVLNVSGGMQLGNF